MTESATNLKIEASTLQRNDQIAAYYWTLNVRSKRWKFKKLQCIFFVVFVFTRCGKFNNLARGRRKIVQISIFKSTVDSVVRKIFQWSHTLWEFTFRSGKVSLLYHLLHDVRTSGKKRLEKNPEVYHYISISFYKIITVLIFMLFEVVARIYRKVHWKYFHKIFLDCSSSYNIHSGSRCTYSGVQNWVNDKNF